MELIVLKDKVWLSKQKHAGKCVANILKECGLAISQSSNLSLIDLENLALSILKAYDCSPTFLNYNGFPSVLCISVNKALVHGVVTDYVLQSGDLVSVDVGATFEGAIADAARTWIFGEPKSNIHLMLLDTCKKALLAGQNACKIGNRIGAIGNAISKIVNKSPFGLVTEYGGHGINYNKPHADPFIANKQSSEDGIRITTGLSIAIEPMAVIGQPKTFLGPDKFTVFTPDLGCHFENSITVMDDGVHIITEISEEL